MGKKPDKIRNSTDAGKMERMSDLRSSKLFGWPSERWIALAALIVAVCSLWVSIDAQRVARRDARLNMQPRLIFSFIFNETGAGWRLVNEGLGTARLRGFRISIDGKAISDFQEIGKALQLPQPLDLHFTMPRVGDRYPSHFGNILYWLGPGEAAKALTKQMDKVKIQACYCSLYGECWLFSSDGTLTSPDGEHIQDDNCSIFSNEPKSNWWKG